MIIGVGQEVRRRGPRQMSPAAAPASVHSRAVCRGGWRAMPAAAVFLRLELVGAAAEAAGVVGAAEPVAPAGRA